MHDPFASFLQRFDLRSRLFFSGNLCRLADFDASEGVGHLHVLRGGELSIRLADASLLRIDRPSAIFFPRPSTHQLVVDEQRGADLVCFSVEFGAQVGNPLVHGLPEVMPVPLDELPALSGLLAALFTEAFGDEAGRIAALDRLSEVVLLHLMRHALRRGELRAGVLAGMADPRLAPVLESLHATPARDWTLEAMAEVAGMSRARFAVHFTEVVGASPGEYLAGWRIGLAQALMLRGRALKTIADEVGYGSANALGRAFTQRLGMSPSAWLAARRAVAGDA